MSEANRGLGAGDVRRLAVEADVDPMTVRRWLRGERCSWFLLVLMGCGGPSLTVDVEEPAVLVDSGGSGSREDAPEDTGPDASMSAEAAAAPDSAPHDAGSVLDTSPRLADSAADKFEAAQPLCMTFSGKSNPQGVTCPSGYSTLAVCPPGALDWDAGATVPGWTYLYTPTAGQWAGEEFWCTN
jgi:hypothetical protein